MLQVSFVSHHIVSAANSQITVGTPTLLASCSSDHIKLWDVSAKEVVRKIRFVLASKGIH